MNVNSITHSGARLLMTIPLSGFSGGVAGECPENCHGISAGDAIRYNPLPYAEHTEPSGGKYTKASGDVAQHSEVVGIVETVDVANDSVSVIIAGQIKYPSSRLISATHVDPDMGLATITGASGGNDIYFLSEVTAGRLQNLAPKTPGTIAKPIFQVAPDGDYTGQVVNYIGYQIGGNVVGEETFSEPAASHVNQLLFGNDNGSSLTQDGWFNATIRHWFPLHIEDLNYVGNTYNKTFKAFGIVAGARYKVTLSSVIDTALSTIINKQATQKNGSRTIIGKYTVVEVDKPNNVLWLEGAYELDSSKKIHIGTSSYTIASSTVTAFANPISLSTSTRSQSFTDINGNPLNVREVPFLKMPADGQGLAVTLVPHATFDSITVTNQVNIENSSVKITDLTQTVKEIADAVAGLKIKIDNTPTESGDNIFLTRFESK
tara:strand:- start:1088 stop:2386 length:1299 start_codon:yes stop_codon:yes gene_type:complete